MDRFELKNANIIKLQFFEVSKNKEDDYFTNDD